MARFLFLLRDGSPNPPQPLDKAFYCSSRPGEDDSNVCLLLPVLGTKHVLLPRRNGCWLDFCVPTREGTPNLSPPIKRGSESLNWAGKVAKLIVALIVQSFGSIVCALDLYAQWLNSTEPTTST